METTFSLRNRLDELPVVLDAVETFFLGERLSVDLASELRLVVEEGLSNIIKYAYDTPEERLIEVCVSVADGEVGVRFRDDGRPFNPLAEHDGGASPEEDQIGGLGIRLMKALTDEASYERQSGRNMVSLKKRV